MNLYTELCLVLLVKILGTQLYEQVKIEDTCQQMKVGGIKMFLNAPFNILKRKLHCEEDFCMVGCLHN